MHANDSTRYFHGLSGIRRRGMSWGWEGLISEVVFYLLSIMGSLEWYNNDDGNDDIKANDNDDDDTFTIDGDD